MSQWNTPVCGPVNQEDRDGCSANSFVSGGLAKVDSVTNPGIEESRLDNGTENDAPEPGSSSQRLAEPVVDDLSYGDKRRLCDNTAKIRTV